MEKKKCEKDFTNVRKYDILNTTLYLEVESQVQEKLNTRRLATFESHSRQ